ncbi:hypothetical protein K458DRAFT_490986 [Lentithecium fluviatile CBS 122367]|uniref:Uncharacterized protein n=1 Tax=Lentithecium fluviatile CBS 122367 TaxID=1168545 RepID=A0A6G1ILF8_9PLEO|nr:hypothetical protein K458DRAFT_490986 [Lentithecium fluviatile CBS 122367]
MPVLFVPPSHLICIRAIDVTENWPFGRRQTMQINPVWKARTQTRFLPRQRRYQTGQRSINGLQNEQLPGVGAREVFDILKQKRRRDGQATISSIESLRSCPGRENRSRTVHEPDVVDSSSLMMSVDQNSYLLSRGFAANTRRIKLSSSSDHSDREHRAIRWREFEGCGGEVHAREERVVVGNYGDELVGGEATHFRFQGWLRLVLVGRAAVK